jgi:hypothetical protein
VYGNTVRYGKNGLYRIFGNWHRIYGKVRYGVRYGPFFHGLIFLTLRFMFSALFLGLPLPTCSPLKGGARRSVLESFCKARGAGRVLPPRPTLARFAVGPERSINVKVLSL